MTTKLELDWVTTSIDELRDIYKEVIANKLEQSMTDTLHKNTESCTGSDTPETFAEKFYSDYHGCYVCFAEHAEDLERERNIWKSRADTYQQDYEQMLRRIDVVATDRDDWKLLAVEQEKEIDALRREWEHAKSYKKVMKEQHKQLTSRLDVLYKNNRKLLTLLQEHGLTEYGN